MGNAENAVDTLTKQIGNEEVATEWHTVDQSQINLFADATGDHQFIHIDPERAKATPWGTTIAHGFLTLSLLPFLQGKIPSDGGGFEVLMMGVNYGLDRVRFPSPVKVDSKVRARRELVSAEVVAPNTVQTKNKVTVEIDGEGKPACVAEFLTRLVFG